ncbi:hypothetical protein J3E72DRAFT_273646 [Bipolaris maydis]|nr:hypothetical protein J3E72DRAFT_273646 [Bipolaris maydis]
MGKVYLCVRNTQGSARAVKAKQAWARWTESTSPPQAPCHPSNPGGLNRRQFDGCTEAMLLSELGKNTKPYEAQARGDGLAKIYGRVNAPLQAEHILKWLTGYIHGTANGKCWAKATGMAAEQQ